jgi:hypothetical protein
MSRVRTAAGSLDIAAIHVRDAASDLKEVVRGRVRNAPGQLKTFFSSIAAPGGATAEPVSVIGYASSAGARQIDTNPATASASGGVAPFTYAWELVDAAGWTINSPAAASTSFKSPAVNAYESSDGSFRCKITDATGAESYTNDVFANVSNLGDAGGLVP